MIDNYVLTLRTPTPEVWAVNVRSVDITDLSAQVSGLRRSGMTKAQRDILRKKRVLEHAERIGNIRRTWKKWSRSLARIR
jgi:hypothetical protein